LQVRILAFARLRELLGFGFRELDVDDDATVDDVWLRLAHDTAGSTRCVRRRDSRGNGALAAGTTALREGDEIALLPPVGGG